IVLLEITDEALRNPAVLLEELIHLQQITDLPIPWIRSTKGMRSFIHPYQWAEIVANAKAGSQQANLKLARAEAEAAAAAEDAMRYYRRAGLFGKTDRATIDAYLEARGAHTQKRLAEANRLAREEIAGRQKRFERTKKAWSR